MSIIDAPPETPLVLDTAYFTHLRNGDKYVKNEIAKYYFHTKSFPAISSMTIFEANYGVDDQLARSKNNIEIQTIKFRQEINNSLVNISRILPFDQKAAEIAAYIYAHLLVHESKWLQKRRSKKKKGNREAKIWQDVFIVSTALSHNYGLASPDTDIEVIAKYLPNEMFLRLAVWKP